MIERKFIKKYMKEFLVTEFIKNNLNNVGLSNIKLIKTPMGDKIVIKASRPGLVVGRGGENIQRLTRELKNRFELENPQIEIEEIIERGLDSGIMAEKIVNSLERFGLSRFKGIGHKSVMEIMNSGAKGVEILIAGKIPSARAKTWRFYKGYIKKCGDIAVSKVKTAQKTAVLKTGTVGVKVKIMLPDTNLPDDITYKEEVVIEETTGTPEAKELESSVKKTEEESKAKNLKKQSAKKKDSKEKKTTAEKPAKKKKKTAKPKKTEKGKEEKREVKKVPATADKKESHSKKNDDKKVDENIGEENTKKESVKKKSEEVKKEDKKQDEPKNTEEKKNDKESVPNDSAKSVEEKE